MLVEALQDWNRYDFGPTWRLVMQWVQEHAADMPDGRQEMGGCALIVSTGTTKVMGTERYECHRRMADVQLVLHGAEELYNVPVHGLTLAEPFDEGHDIGFFTDSGLATPSRVRLEPGQFVLLMPWDAHLPSMAVNNVPASVRKLVVKLPVDALTL